MEKHTKPRSNILKFLPKAASAVTFQNPPFSPGKDKRPDIHINKLRAHTGKGFSGPIISIIPDEARRKSKNEGFENQEPTSPKVSCMGQIIKHKANHQKKKMSHKKSASLPKDIKPGAVSSSPREVKKQASKFRRLFIGVKPARKSDVYDDDHDQKQPHSAPALSQMKKFASSRNAFSNFDWMAHQISPLESDHRNYYSDEEKGNSDDDEEDHIIPFSAPITVGGDVALQPRKEINLWKRRTMDPPKPLQLNTMVRAN